MQSTMEWNGATMPSVAIVYRFLDDAAGSLPLQCGKHLLPASIIYINIIICVWDVKYMMLFSS